MLVLLIGPTCSGKSAIAQHLIKHDGFKRARIESTLVNRIEQDSVQEIRLETVTKLLDYATLHWQENFVTTDLSSQAAVDAFRKRPWVLVISVEAPTSLRWGRACERHVLSVGAYIEI